MVKPTLVDRPVKKSIYVPTSVAAQVDLELYSELEGRIPHGAFSTLVSNLLRDWAAARVRVRAAAAEAEARRG